MKFTLDAYKKKAQEFQTNWMEVSGIVSAMINSGNIDNNRLLEKLEEVKQGRKRLESRVSGLKIQYPWLVPYFINALDLDWKDNKYIKTRLTKLGHALSKLQYNYKDMQDCERELPKMDIQLDLSMHSAILIAHLT